MSLFYKLSILMGLIVVASNYLVQFPIQYFGLSEILTYAAFSYPITFLITDLANRAYGKIVARKIVYVGFFIGVLLTLLISTNFSDIISIRIAIGSVTAFFIAQNLDIKIFDMFDMPIMSEGKKNKNQLNSAQLVNIIKKHILSSGNTFVIVEQVSAMPGQGVTSMFNFGQTFGAIKGICASLNLPIFYPL